MMLAVLILSLRQLKQLEVPEFGKIVHSGVSCEGCKKKAIVGTRYKCGHCVGDVNFCSNCYAAHQKTEPQHVFVIIREPLPLSGIQKHSPSKPGKKQKPLLPPFEFVPSDGKVVHQDSCEHCNAKQITGKCYKCANCEDYVVCSQCFGANQMQHPNTHVFLEICQPLKESHKTQISLLSVLDSRLYSESQIESQKVVQSTPVKQKTSDEDDDDLEDLAPLAMSRSKSAAVKVVSSADKKEPKAQPLLTCSLSYNQQYSILFRTAVWVCDNKQNFFSKKDQVALLTYLMLNLYELGKVASAECLLQLAKNTQVIQHLYITIVGCNDANLQSIFSSLWQTVKKRHSAMSKAEQKNPTEKSAASMDKRETLIKETELLRDLQIIMIENYQVVLSWLIDIELDPQRLKSVKQAAHLLEQCQGNKNVWLQHMNYAIDGFLDNRASLKGLKVLLKTLTVQPKDKKAPKLEKIVEDLEDDEDSELAPLSMSRSLSMPASGATGTEKTARAKPIHIIKNLVTILTLRNKQNDQD